MMPMALMRILFYLDRPHLLLVVAVAPKHMNGMAKHDVLWRLSLTTTDKPDTQDTSGVAILAKNYELLWVHDHQAPVLKYPPSCCPRRASAVPMEA